MKGFYGNKSTSSIPLRAGSFKSAWVCYPAATTVPPTGLSGTYFELHPSYDQQCEKANLCVCITVTLCMKNAYVLFIVMKLSASRFSANIYSLTIKTVNVYLYVYKLIILCHTSSVYFNKEDSFLIFTLCQCNKCQSAILILPTHNEIMY